MEQDTIENVFQPIKFLKKIFFLKFFLRKKDNFLKLRFMQLFIADATMSLIYLHIFFCPWKLEKTRLKSCS